MICKQLQHFLESSGLLNNSQHGFRKGQSCLTQLLSHYDQVLKALEEGGNCDTVYLDYAKAFDKVDVGLLLQCLKDKGITGNLWRWLLSWLTGRQQRVLANGDISSSVAVTSGVPQGSVLGPLLFLVLIDSIADCNLSSWVSIFADDTRIGRIIRDENDAQALQDDLSSLHCLQMASSVQYEI